MRCKDHLYCSNGDWLVWFRPPTPGTSPTGVHPPVIPGQHQSRRHQVGPEYTKTGLDFFLVVAKSRCSSVCLADHCRYLEKCIKADVLLKFRDLFCLNSLLFILFFFFFLFLLVRPWITPVFMAVPVSEWSVHTFQTAYYYCKNVLTTNMQVRELFTNLLKYIQLTIRAGALKLVQKIHLNPSG